MDPILLHIPLFAGLGTHPANNLPFKQALQDATTPYGAALLQACHTVFLTELDSMASDSTGLHLNVEDFSQPRSLIDELPPQYDQNSLLHSVGLYLRQTLRYLASRTGTSAATGSSPLHAGLDDDAGVLGFSLGLFSAILVSVASDEISYLSHAVNIFKVVVRIGIRMQQYRSQELSGVSGTFSSMPWGVVIVGVAQDKLEDDLAAFSETKQSLPSVYLTAILDDGAFVVSGRPDALKAFTTTSGYASAHPTSLETLYHAPTQENIKIQVIQDFDRRNIRFPLFRDLKWAIRSTVTGDLLAERAGESLLDNVLDMVLTCPVRWNTVISRLRGSLRFDRPVSLMNYGPGGGCARHTQRQLDHPSVKIVDVTVCDDHASMSKYEPIAVVGMAVNMPGAPNTSALWSLLENGLNTLGEIPSNRFCVSGSPDRHLQVRTGNFIDDVDRFDNQFFNISPREAKAMDPQQRILLQVAYNALEDSGYVPDATSSFQRSSFGCFIGVATDDYAHSARDSIDLYYSTGTLRSFLSGRLSYAFQFSGPSVVVDTACSSSCVAIYQAVRALNVGDCNAALAGGVNVIASPEMFIGLDRGHFLSPTGPCKPFDASADGYSRAEGCGVFVLKRLSDAVAENDNILGVIRGVEVNQSGQAHSITHPHTPTQIALFKRLLENAAVDPRRVNVVESHGTGTQAGDVAELSSIRSVFSSHRRDNNPLYVTSIKGNTGHLEAASGAASLAKLLLMLRYRSIPPQVSFNILNPSIPPLHEDNTVISINQVPWSPSSTSARRIAVLNNFGAAGSNAALVLEEYPSALQPVLREAIPLVFGLSAKTPDALERSRLGIINWLSDPGNADATMTDIAYTATARRQLYPYRLATVASGHEELARLLKTTTVPSSPTACDINVVFAFSGQGGQYVGMGRQLYQTSRLFKERIDECNGILLSLGFHEILSYIKAEVVVEASVEMLEVYQTASFSLQYGLAHLWISWGVEPIAVTGHSLGEYAALVLGGVLCLKDALLLIGSRAQLMIQKCARNETGMLAVSLDEAQLQAELDLLDYSACITIACYNGPGGIVLSGPKEKLQLLQKHLERSSTCKAITLNVPFGYHSCAMEPIVDDFRRIVLGVSFNSPTLPIASTALGRLIYPEDSSAFDAEYLVRQTIDPVFFDSSFRTLVDSPLLDKRFAILELGPHPSLLPMLKSIDVPEGTLFLATLRKGVSPWQTLSNSLALLYPVYNRISWKSVFGHVPSLSCISLPGYPFLGKSFWIQSKADRCHEPAHLQPTLNPVTPALRSLVQYPSKENDHTAVLETPIVQVEDLILGHRVVGIPLCPASLYLEQVQSAVQLTYRHAGLNTDQTVIMNGVEFVNALTYEKDTQRVIRTSISVQQNRGTFVIASMVPPSKEEVIHVRGEYLIVPIPEVSARFARVCPGIRSCIRRVTDPNEHYETFSSRTAYDMIFARVVDYSSHYRAMQFVTRRDKDAFACVELPTQDDGMKSNVYPIFLDALLQLPGFLANMRGGLKDAFICSHIESVELLRDEIDPLVNYCIYSTLTYSTEENVITADVTAIRLGVPEYIIAQLKGVRFRGVRLEKLRNGLNIPHRSGRMIPRRNTTGASCPPGPISFVRRRETSSPLNMENVQPIVQSVIGIACEIDLQLQDSNVELDTLGVDSLMFLEITHRLQLAFPDTRLNHHSLSSCKTVSDVVLTVEAALDRSALDVFTPHSPTNTESSISSPRTLVDDDRPFPSNPYPKDVNIIRLRVLIASTLDIALDDVLDDTVLDDLGLDSLASIETIEYLVREYGLSLPPDLFSICKTPVQLRRYLLDCMVDQDGVAKNGASPRPGCLAPSPDPPSYRPKVNPQISVIRSSGDGIPVFFIHDGSGTTSYYSRLDSLNRPVYGIDNLYSNAHLWVDVEEMAEAYAYTIEAFISGSFIIGGWSFGGVAAFAVAKVLERRGFPVHGLLIIDSPSPIQHTPLSDDVIASAIQHYHRSDRDERVGQLRQQFMIHSKLLSTYAPLPLRTYLPVAFLRSTDPFIRKEDITVPSWLCDRRDRSILIKDWETLVCGEVKTYDIPGNHFEAFHDSHIRILSQHLREACRYLEERSVLQVF